MMSTSERNEVLLEVADLAGDLQHRAVEADAIFDDLTRNAARFLPGAQFAGITVVRKRAVETLGATHEYVAVLDNIQRRHQEGPCLSADWEHHVIRIDDLASEARWPRYRNDALVLTPIRSILSIRLFGEGNATGAINFYAEPTNVFDDESVELGLVFATHAALVWEIVRRNDQFQSALASRDIIGQAKGMIMERYDINAVQAFELLKRLSQQSNISVANIARQLVYTDHPPP